MDEILNLIESVSEGFPSYFCSKHFHKTENNSYISVTWAVVEWLEQLGYGVESRRIA